MEITNETNYSILGYGDGSGSGHRNSGNGHGCDEDGYRNGKGFSPTEGIHWYGHYFLNGDGDGYGPDHGDHEGDGCGIGW